MKLRPFELGLVVVFVVMAFVALLLFSNYEAKNKDGEVTVGAVTIWGVLPFASVNDILKDLKDANEAYNKVSYRSISVDSFNDTLVNALADGNGPDLILLSHEQLVQMRKRIAAISYDSFPIRDIRNTYVDGAQIFAMQDGLYAYPVVVDPLVMYWNRDSLLNKDLLNPPTTWEELVNNHFPSLIERDFDRTITHSVVAMGEYPNIRNAFGVISTLLLQAGTNGVVEEEGGYDIQLDESANGSRPLTTTVDFYTRFSRVNNSLYSWNRSFIEDRSMFASEDLSFYFGYGSEARELESLNPNLNFDIAEIPQGATANVKRTYANFYGFAILRAAKNKAGGAVMMSILSNRTNAARIAASVNMAPAFRDLVSAGSNDTYGRIIYRSTAVSFGWLNPPKEAVDSIFTTMTRDVNENRNNESGAASDAVRRLELEYN